MLMYWTVLFATFQLICIRDDQDYLQKLLYWTTLFANGTLLWMTLIICEKIANLNTLQMMMCIIAL